MAESLPEILTADQLAQLLDCTPETVEASTRERVLPGLKFGRSWIYPRDAVLEVLRRQALHHVRSDATAAAPTAAPRAAPSIARAQVPAPTRKQRRQPPQPLPDPPSASPG